MYQTESRFSHSNSQRLFKFLFQRNPNLQISTNLYVCMRVSYKCIIRSVISY